MSHHYKSLALLLFLLGIGFTALQPQFVPRALADTKTGTYYCAWQNGSCGQIGGDSCQVGYKVDPSCGSFKSESECNISIAGGISRGLKACQSVSIESNYYYCQWISSSCKPLGNPNCAKGFEPDHSCSEFQTLLDCQGTSVIRRACKAAVPGGTTPTPSQKTAPATQGGGSSAITLYEDKNFNNYGKDEGKAHYAYSQDVQNFYQAAVRFGVSSIKITEGTWEICEKENYGWRCLQRNQDIPDLGKVKVDGKDLDNNIHSIRRIDNKGSVPPRIVLFQDDNYGGEATTLDGDASKVSGFGVTSIRVLGGTWEVCEKENYLGSCLKLNSDAADLRDKSFYVDGQSLNDKISSLRAAAGGEEKGGGGLGGDKETGGGGLGGGKETGGGTLGGEFKIKNPLQAGTIPDILNAVSGFLYAIALAFVTVMVLWGGFQILTAAGSPAQIDKGKQTLLWAVIGTVVILIAGGIAGIIKDILGGPA